MKNNDFQTHQVIINQQYFICFIFIYAKFYDIPLQIFKMIRLQFINQQIGGKAEFIYSVPIGPKPKGETAVHRKPSQKDALLKIPSEITSLSALWDQSVKKFGSNLFIEDFTFKQVDEMARRVGSWISSRNHKLFFLYSLNCPNWTISDIASWNYGFVNVPLYDTLGHEAFDHILKITEGTLLFTTKSLVNNLVGFLSKNKYNLKEVCFFDDFTQEERKKLQSFGITVSSFKEALNHKQTRPRPQLNLESELSYGFTSGTTGVPKGVIYTHRMVISQSYAMIGYYQLYPTDIHMSYLPIAHTFQRFVIWQCTFFGTNIRYAKHPIAEILKDFAICKPTTIPIVPRLLNKFYPVLKGIYEKEGNFTKIRAIFGGRLRLLVTGSAPIAPPVLSFFKEALGADIRQGYGQTQTTAASFVTSSGDTNYGHVGGPNASVEFKLVDVPQMNYFTDGKEPKGEICVRGQSIFKQYFKDPKNTAQTVDKDGWNHSGDIGLILPNGALKIIDRKKNIYKLQQGQYIAPEKIENVYVRCPYAAECFVYGDSLKYYNVAIIHPNLELLPVLADKLGIKEKDVKQLCANPQITKFILDELTKQGKNDGLMSFEQAKKIRLWHEPFQVVGIVTSTMKLQRHIGKEKFKLQLEEMYKQN